MIKNYLFLFVLQMIGTLCLGQSSEISWQFKEEKLVDVLKKIESTDGLLFSFKNDEVKEVLVTCSVATNKLQTALDCLFGGTPFFYTISESNFVLLNTKKQITISGKVLTQDTEEPLAYANVYVENGAGTSTDLDGNFSLELEFSKKDELVISYISFEPDTISLKNWSSLETYDFKLKSSASSFSDFLVIKDYITDGIELTDNGSETTLKPRHIGKFAGQVNPEVLSLIQILPGISSPSSKAADIRIRGCTPDQNLIVWEDIPIYHSAHYFGMISAINPYTIEEVKTYRGGFGAEYGGRIGGVIDMKSSDEKSIKSYYGVGTNMTHGFLYGNHKFSKKRPSSINFSLRRSFTELLRTPTFDNITKINQQGLLIGNKEVQTLPDHISIKDRFNFIDTHLKIASQLSKKDRMSLSVLYAANDFTDRIVDNIRNEAHTDSMQLNNKGISAHWQRNWSERNETILKLVGTEYGYDYTYGLGPIGNQNLRLSGLKMNTIKDQQLTLISKNKIGKNQILETAYQFINYNISYEVEELNVHSKDIRESAETSSGLHTFYTIFKNPISNVLGINMGLRTSYYLENEKLYFEPRLRFARSLSSDLSLHLNFGRHYQFVSQILTFRGNDNGISSALWALAENRSFPVQKSDLFQTGLIYNKASWLMDLQLYRRNISDLSSRAFNFVTTDDSTPFIGDGRVYGLDVLVKKRIGKIKSWLSYSLSKNEYLFEDLDRDYFEANQSQTNILKWGAQLNFKKFDFSFSYKYASGLPYSLINGFDRTSQQMGPDLLTPRYDGINNYNLNPQQDLDASLGYRFTSRQSYTCYVDFSISNILNRENLSSREYYIDTAQDQMPVIDFVDRATLPFTPNLGVRFEW